MKIGIYFLFFITNIYSQVNEKDSINISDDKTYKVSINHIIANSEKYDGKIVFFIGYISLERDSFIFSYKDDYKNKNYSNSIQLVFSTTNVFNLKKGFRKKYVYVKGRFHTPPDKTTLKSSACGVYRGGKCY